jgi:serine/threonine protein phosphatase PrpC
MGAYLAVPITAKERFEGQGALSGRAPMNVVYGGAAMQGWRRTMEDAHLAEVGLGMPGGAPGGDAAVFGVFDGHGGAEVALFCQRYMAQELQKLEAFGVDAVEDALVDVFHRMDDMLRDHTFADEIEALKARDAAEEDEGKGEDDGVSPMDALEMIKRVFQLKRFMGENGQPGEGGGEGGDGGGAAAAGAGAAADEAVAMEDDAEGPSGQDEPQRQRPSGGGGASSGGAGGSGPRGSGGGGSGGGAAAGAGAGADAAPRPGGSSGSPPWQQRGSEPGAAAAAGDGEQQGELQRYVEPADARIQAGCTAVVAVIKAGHLYVANAGDSRGVLCRGGTALAMSEDHKPAQETERTRILNAGGCWGGGGGGGGGASGRGGAPWGRLVGAPPRSRHPRSAAAAAAACCTPAAAARRAPPPAGRPTAHAPPAPPPLPRRLPV